MDHNITDDQRPSILSVRKIVTLFDENFNGIAFFVFQAYNCKKREFFFSSEYNDFKLLDVMETTSRSKSFTFYF